MVKRPMNKSAGLSPSHSCKHFPAMRFYYRKSAGLGPFRVNISGRRVGFDEDFIPEVDLAHHTLTYTIVMGEVLANYEATPKN